MMKIYIAVLCLFCFVHAVPLDNINHQYCALKQPEIFRSCLIENRAGISVDIFRNCAMQVKFYHTLDELTEYLCKDTNSEDFSKFDTCMNNALRVEDMANPSFSEIVQKCATKAANAQ